LGKQRLTSQRLKGARRPSTHFPARKRRGSYLTVTGNYPSPKTPHLAFFEGLRERDFFVLLDFDDDVEFFESHPIHIDHQVAGRVRIYTPDVLVTYRTGADDKPVRRHELCEVKVRHQVRKDWMKLRARFRAAQRYGRSRHWRFRLVHEHTIPRPFVASLHFLLGYRRSDEQADIVAAIHAQLASSEGLDVATLVERLEAVGLDGGDVIVQAWRLVGRRELSIDFEHPISMTSVLRPAPWTVRRVLHQLRVEAMTRKRSGTPTDETEKRPAGELLGSAGTDIVPIEKGGTYARRDRAGVYTVVQFEDAQTVAVKEHGTGTLETIDVSVLAPFAERESAARRDMLALTEEEREAVLFKYEAIRPFIDRRRISREDADAAARAAGVSLKAWRGWLRAYHKNPVLASLMRRRRKDAGKTRLDPMAELLLKAYVDRWLNSTDQMSSVHRELQDEIKARNRADPIVPLVCPDYATFYNRCNSLPQHLIVERREGKRTARLSHGLQRGSFAGADYPLAVVQIDHTPLPVQIIDEVYGLPIGTAVITVVIDLFSRMVVGYYLTLEAPGDLSLGLALSHAMLPKTELLKQFDIREPWPCSGRMRMVCADNAGEFHGKMMEMGCKIYGIEMEFRKVKHPNYGGHIESFMGTLSGLLRAVDGATLSGPHELGERDPQAEATLTLRQLERWVLLQLMIYHHSEHSGLQGQRPIDRWRDGFRGSSTEPGIGKVFIPKDTFKLQLDFMPMTERVVAPQGIVWDHIWYSDPALQKWVHARDPKNLKATRQFICRRDPRDLSRIYFWDPEIEQYRVIRYRTPTRPQITIWEYQAVQKHLLAEGRKHIDEDVIFEGREQVRRLLEDARNSADRKRRARESERRRAAEEKAERFTQELGVERAPALPDPSEKAASEDDVEMFEDFIG
jgi:putative transposase